MEEVAAKAGDEPQRGRLKQRSERLRTLELVQSRGELRAGDDLLSRDSSGG